MHIVNRKNFKSKMIALCITALSFVCIAVTIFGLVGSNLNMNSKQGMPDIKDCVLDFSGYDIDNRYWKQCMMGSYEFFYNKWIVEENYTGKPDAIVNVPHHFSQTTINGKKLTNKGYASYRIVVTGLKKDTPVYFTNTNFIGACYGYINGELIYQQGTRNKDGESRSNGGAEVSKTFYVKDESPLDVVFEVSSSKQGGLISPAGFIIMTLPQIPATSSLTNNIGFIVLGLIFALFIFSFIIKFGDDIKFAFSFNLVMLSMVFLTIFSIDVHWRLLSFLRFNTFNIMMDMNFIANFTLLFALMFSFFKGKVLSLNKIYLICLFGVCLISAALYVILMGSFAQIVAPMLQCACLLSLIFPLTRGITKTNMWNVLYILFIISAAIYITCTSFDLLHITIAGLEQSISYVMLPMIIMIIFLYRHISAENSKKLILALKTEREHSIIKADALKAQIKPHFIFNSLSNIQSAYEVDKNLGDKALNMFSKHLRANVDSSSIETVPFSQELENILNYIELENMRREQPVNVLLDCMDIEFNLPILSLQPFVENAFKHSGVDRITGGYIEIKTYQNASHIIVEISDNGIGFNLKDVKNSSVGLKNARERLLLLSNASVEIKTKPQKGTKAFIKFPIDKLCQIIRNGE